MAGTKLDQITTETENGRVVRAEGRAGGRTHNLMGVQSVSLSKEPASFGCLFFILFLMGLSVVALFIPGDSSMAIVVSGQPLAVFLPAVFIVPALVMIFTRKPRYIINIGLISGGRFFYETKKANDARKVLDDLKAMILR